jgi:hypothetical protein
MMAEGYIFPSKEPSGIPYINPITARSLPVVDPDKFALRVIMTASLEFAYLCHFRRAAFAGPGSFSSLIAFE